MKILIWSLPFKVNFKIIKLTSVVNMELLPEDCFAHILSFTSPQDVCRSSQTSSIVRSMADSDSVWEKFLPLYYHGIISRLVVPPSLPCSSKKDLFVRLCKPQLVDDGNKVTISNTNIFCFQYLLIFQMIQHGTDRHH